METFRRAAWGALALAALFGLQGCLVSKVVTVPVKLAYGTTKLVVKGTAAAVRAVVPDDDEEEAEKDKDRQDPPREPPSRQ